MNNGIPNNRNEGYSEFRSALNFAEFVAGLFAKTIAVFFRHDFGTRYFSWSSAVGSTFALVTTTLVVTTVINSGEKTGQSAKTTDLEMLPLTVFLLGFIGISLLHNGLAWQYKKRRPLWYSRYTGTSHLHSLLPQSFRDSLNRDVMPFFGVSLHYVIQRFVEPLLTITAGMFTGYVINAPLGAWLITGGLSLAAVEWLNATRYKRRITDAIDAQIEAQWIGEAITTTAPDANKTAGFVLPVPNYLGEKERKKIYNGMVRLDPALQAIMDEPILEPATAAAQSSQNAEIPARLNTPPSPYG